VVERVPRLAHAPLPPLRAREGARRQSRLVDQVSRGTRRAVPVAARGDEGPGIERAGDPGAARDSRRGEGLLSWTRKWSRSASSIDQILGYLAWRDTKAAILLFNRRRELSKVLAQIPALVAAHPAFGREIPYGDETAFRFVLRRPDDPEREVTLTILVFEVPA
jgi:hypothetical protein